MSSETPTATQDGRRVRRASIGRALDKVKTAWNKTHSLLRTSADEPSSSETGASRRHSVPLPPTVVAASVGPERLEVDSEPFVRESHVPVYVPIKRNSVSHQDRARVIFNRYGLNFDDYDTIFYEDGPRQDVQRVEKQIRMRVRYTCHACNSPFGSNRVCNKCEHSRCSICPRTPARRRQRSTADRIPSSGSHSIQPATVQVAGTTVTLS